jgi:hypothetical protein
MADAGSGIGPILGIREGNAVKGQDQFLLISTPRSGSDWLAHCLGWAHPAYHREFFCPPCNLFCQGELRQCFGSEVDWQNIALPWECQPELIDFVYRHTWAAQKSIHGLRSTKENWSAFKIGFLDRHFDCFAMVGHRKHTFPGRSKPRETMYWWSRYYESLVLNVDLLDEDIAGPVRRSIASALGIRQKMGAAQVIATYQTVKECDRLGIPIIEYRRLVACRSAEEVYSYLDGKVPAAIMNAEVTGRVVANMNVPDKVELYNALGVEDFCRDLIDSFPVEYRRYF